MHLRQTRGRKVANTRHPIGSAHHMARRLVGVESKAILRQCAGQCSISRIGVAGKWYKNISQDYDLHVLESHEQDRSFDAVGRKYINVDSAKSNTYHARILVQA